MPLPASRNPWVLPGERVPHPTVQVAWRTGSGGSAIDFVFSHGESAGSSGAPCMEGGITDKLKQIPKVCLTGR